MSTIDIPSVFTWSRVALTVGALLTGGATFIAGQIAGANELEPRVAQLEARTEAVEHKLSKQGEDLAEIKGYVRAIAGKMGVSP